MPVGQTSTPSVAARAAAVYQAQQPDRSSGAGITFGVLAALVAVASVVFFLVPWAGLMSWATQEQRAFQNAMAGSLRAIRGGDSVAILALCGATAAYGFVHALGPGHGKVLLGGAALASGATARRMLVLTLVSSLAQAASAILLVLVVALMFGWATRDLIGWTEAWLAPASAMAIAAIGGLLMIRGLRAWRSVRPRALQQNHVPCGCGHAHAPTASEVQSLNSIREALALVGSIAMRPCTGALFVLVIALRMDIFVVGCLAVIAMGLGTAAFNLLVTFSGLAARRVAALPLDSGAMQRFSASVHIGGGALIAATSIMLAMTYLDKPFFLP